MLVVADGPEALLEAFRRWRAAGAREVDRSRAVLSSASIASPPPSGAARRARRGAARERRLQPPELDDVARRRRRERGDRARRRRPAIDQPADRAVVVGGERDPRRRSRPRGRRGVSTGCRSGRCWRSTSRAASRAIVTTSRSAGRVARRERDEHLVVAQRSWSTRPVASSTAVEVVVEHDREVEAAVAQAVGGQVGLVPARGESSTSGCSARNAATAGGTSTEAALGNAARRSRPARTPRWSSRSPAARSSCSRRIAAWRASTVARRRRAHAARVALDAAASRPRAPARRPPARRRTACSRARWPPRSSSLRVRPRRGSGAGGGRA